VDNNGAYGYHAWEVKIGSLTKPLLVVSKKSRVCVSRLTMQVTFIHQMFLPATIWLIKVTLLVLILNSFKPIKWLRVLCWIGIVTTFAFYTTNFVVQLVACRPRGGTDRISFLAGMASRQCAGSNTAVQKVSIAAGIFGVISDLYILIIPLPAVMGLHLSSKRKLGVMLSLSSGGL
jgi:hypothetical protein